MKPATPLPFIARDRSDLLKAGEPSRCYWEIEGGSGFLVDGKGFCLTSYIHPDDATYIAHACNYYPRLVAELDRLQDIVGDEDFVLISALLRELGEDK